MTTLAFINQKGGVAKTTSSVHVATALAAFHDKRVLLIDLDAQAQCCLTFGYPDAGTTRTTKLGHLLEHIEERNTDLSQLFQSALLDTGIPNLDILPGQKKIKRYFIPEPGQQERYDLIFLLITAIQHASRPADQHAGPYDWVIIDTPPALEAPTKNAIAAADFALVPIEPSYYSVQGFATFLEGVHALLPQLNKNPDDFYRILPTRINTAATKARADLDEWLGAFNDRFLYYHNSTTDKKHFAYIRQCIALSRCLKDLTTVFTFDPGSNGASDHSLLTRLILAYEDKTRQQAQGHATQETTA